MEIKNNVFVVTGGGNGIGRAVVLNLLSKGAKVVGLDINEEGLKSTQEMAGENFDNMIYQKLDITDKESVDKLPQMVLDKFGKVDGIINVAGIVQKFVKINDITMPEIEKIINVNFYGTVYMVKAFLPELLKNKSTSFIANIGSMAGFFPFPRQGIYGASKAAIKIFTEGLYAELKDTNVRVSIIMPGAVDTDIVKNSNSELKAVEGTKSYKALPVGESAEIIVDAIIKEKYKVLVGKDAKAMDKLYRIAPKKAINLINKKMKDHFVD